MIQILDYILLIESLIPKVSNSSQEKKSNFLIMKTVQVCCFIIAFIGKQEAESLSLRKYPFRILEVSASPTSTRLKWVAERSATRPLTSQSGDALRGAECKNAEWPASPGEPLDDINSYNRDVGCSFSSLRWKNVNKNISNVNFVVIITGSIIFSSVFLIQKLGYGNEFDTTLLTIRILVLVCNYMYH